MYKLSSYPTLVERDSAPAGPAVRESFLESESEDSDEDEEEDRSGKLCLSMIVEGENKDDATTFANNTLRLTLNILFE